MRPYDDAQHLHPTGVRIGRSSPHYEATVEFYRDLVGLPVVEELGDSCGGAGTIFGLPDTTVQLAIMRANDAHPAAAFDQLLLYLGSADAVTSASAALRDAGFGPTPNQHPSWTANGAVHYPDPDGRHVVFVPCEFGPDPQPAGATGDARALDALRIGWYDGDRDALRPLFVEAEDSPAQLDSYIDSGRVLAAWRADDLIGHLQLVPHNHQTIELKNMAVAERLRGTGIGTALVDAALAAAAEAGATTMVVATAAADIGNLRFYQRCGFRFTTVERDAFIAATGYPEPIAVDGITLRDRLWLDRPVIPADEPH